MIGMTVARVSYKYDDENAMYDTYMDHFLALGDTFVTSLLLVDIRTTRGTRRAVFLNY